MESGKEECSCEHATKEECSDEQHTTNGEEPLSTREILGWMELSCWTTVALAPFLYWVNGPAVSTDQFVVRTILVTVAVVGGIVLRGVRWHTGAE